jgi:hypothetical protein
MRKISEIYEKYKIMPNLQEHMYKVAGVASLICDNFNGSLPKDEIISTCLLHDIGNIVKFKLDKFPNFLEPEGLDYWSGIQNSYFKKYGYEQHEATSQIIKEIGISNIVLDLAKHVGFSMAENNLKNNSFARKICAYSDMRVAVFGVRSLKERLDDLSERYSKKSIISNSSVEYIHKCFFEIEKQIFNKCKIKPEYITDETVSSIVLELKNFVL